MHKVRKLFYFFFSICGVCFIINIYDFISTLVLIIVKEEMPQLHSKCFKAVKAKYFE